MHGAWNVNNSDDVIIFDEDVKTDFYVILTFPDEEVLLHCPNWDVRQMVIREFEGTKIKWRVNN